MAGRLGDILIERGQLTPEQLQEALATRGLLGETLLSNGWVTRPQLGSALAEQFEVPYENISAEDIPAQIVRLVPEQFARARRIVPVRVRKSWMLLAMEAPDDIEAISEVELLTGYKIDPAVALREDVLQVLDRGFDERITARQTAVDIRVAELESARDSGDLHVDVTTDDEAPVVRLVKSILIGAVNAGASDIHLEPHKPQMRIRYRVDGELQQVMTVPNDSEEAVIGVLIPTAPTRGNSTDNTQGNPFNPTLQLDRLMNLVPMSGQQETHKRSTPTRTDSSRIELLKFEQRQLSDQPTTTTPARRPTSGTLTPPAHEQPARPVTLDGPGSSVRN